MVFLRRSFVIIIILILVFSVSSYYISLNILPYQRTTVTISETYTYYMTVSTYSVSMITMISTATRFIERTHLFTTTILTTVAQPAKNLVVWAWIYNTSSEDVPEIISRYGGSVIDIVSPDWYYLADNLSIGRFFSRGAEDPGFLRLVRGKGVLVTPMVVSANTDRVSRLISDLSAMERFSNTLIETAQRMGYAGYNIDFEVSLPNQARDFAYFLDYVAKKLHQSGLVLSVAIPAKRTEWPSSYTMTYDYEAIGKSAVDYIMIMAYDYYESPGPKPVAPIWWVQDVVEYALKSIPKEKLFLGVPNYGKVMDSNGRITQWILYTDYQALRRSGVNFTVDQSDQELFAKIDDKYVYYIDGELAYLRAKIAQKYDLVGVAIWRLDNSDPSLWNYLKDLKPCQRISIGSSG